MTLIALSRLLSTHLGWLSPYVDYYYLFTVIIGDPWPLFCHGVWCFIIALHSIIFRSHCHRLSWKTVLLAYILEFGNLLTCSHYRFRYSQLFILWISIIPPPLMILLILLYVSSLLLEKELSNLLLSSCLLLIIGPLSLSLLHYMGAFLNCLYYRAIVVWILGICWFMHVFNFSSSLISLACRGWNVYIENWSSKLDHLDFETWNYFHSPIAIITDFLVFIGLFGHLPSCWNGLLKEPSNLLLVELFYPCLTPFFATKPSVSWRHLGLRIQL